MRWSLVVGSAAALAARAQPLRCLSSDATTRRDVVVLDGIGDVAAPRQRRGSSVLALALEAAACAEALDDAVDARRPETRRGGFFDDR